MARPGRRLYPNVTAGSALAQFRCGTIREAELKYGTAAMEALAPHLTEPEDSLTGLDRLANAATARRAWLWLNLALPADLLLSALGTEDDNSARVELVTPALELHLRERGFAETHLHVGVALDFPQLWSVAMRAMADSRLGAEAFRAPGAELNDGAELAPWLMRAALGRYVLASYLRRADSAGNFHEWLRSACLPMVSRTVGPGNAVLLNMALADLTRGRLSPSRYSFALLRRLYARIAGVSAQGGMRSQTELVDADPVGRLFRGDNATGRTPEVRFTVGALRHLDGRNDPDFALLFWQVVRVRALFFRHVVQRPMTPGLQWFVRFYSRSGPARKPLEIEALLESAALMCGANRGLRSLEFRTGPGPNLSELLEYTSKVNEFVRRRQPGSSGNEGALRKRRSWAPTREPTVGPLEIGLVLHFIKDRGGGTKEGCPQAHWRAANADPGSRNRRDPNPSGYRYAGFFKQKRREAMALEKLLRHFPLSLESVRGLDVCTDELGVATWVFVPIFDRVRAAANQAAIALCGLLHRRVPTLRTTVHAGEDYVHLLTGLRHVDEAVEQFNLREGDRIGHGLALGVDPRDWATRAGRLAMIAEERLFDLVWEWGCYGRQVCRPVAGRPEHIEREITLLSELIFGEPQPPRSLERLQEDLCNSLSLYAVGFPDGTKPRQPDGSPLRFLHNYLTDPNWFDRGRRILWIDPAGEAESLVALQACLRHKIGSRGLTVEVNPTSNLLIGDLSDLTRHPLWRLHPPRGNGDAPPVSVCIGSDDPLVFASNLPQEYQLLHDAMTLAGLSDEEARQWLDRCRRCGLESRFTLSERDPRPLKSVLGTNTLPGRRFLL
jgi:hypothetical protein